MEFDLGAKAEALRSEARALPEKTITQPSRPSAAQRLELGPWDTPPVVDELKARRAGLWSRSTRVRTELAPR